MESPETAKEIQTIRFEIQSIRSTQEIFLRERAEEILPKLLAVLNKAALLGEIYLAVNGERTQAQVLTYLHSNKVKTSQPALSRWLAILEDEGLIEKVAVEGSATIWAKKDELERVFKLSRYVRGARGRNKQPVS